MAFNAGVWYERQQVSSAVTPKIVNEDAGKPKDLDFSLFWDTWRTLEEKYPTKPDRTKMFYGAIEGMVKSLGDPYTVFMDPEETKKFADELDGTFEGIGAPVGLRKGILTIIDPPLSDSPAEKAGLKPMDEILKVDNTETIDLSLDESVNLIRGPKGTTVTLTIQRGNEDETKEFRVIRDTIVIKSVELEYKNTDKGKIAILKISRFGEDTFQLVNIAAGDILKTGAKGIILDLRSNPGGYLESAVDIAGNFLPSGKLVTTEAYSNDNKEPNYTRGDNKLGSLPLVVLINGGSASAAEILAGALHDDRQIKLIGEKTFGKGSVQEIQKNSKDNSSLKITVAEWLTPSNININKAGIKPDIEKKISREDFDAGKDPQLDAALKTIGESI